jgi:mRNA interferase MazF
LVISLGQWEQDHALAALVPQTTGARKSRSEVKLGVSFLRDGVFDAQSLITVPHGKLIRKLGVLPNIQFRELEQAVGKWLGLENAAILVLRVGGGTALLQSRINGAVGQEEPGKRTRSSS